MKNETTRTKTQTGFSSRAIALVLCFVMLLTAIGSGSVLSAIAVAAEGSGAAELVDAAKAGADINAPAPGEAEESSDVLEPEDIDDGFALAKKGDSDVADTGADKDIAVTGYSTVYVSGDWDGWTEHEINGDGFTVSLSASTTYELAFHADSDWFKSDYTVSGNHTDYRFPRDNNGTINVKLKTTISGEYIIKLHTTYQDSVGVDFIYPAAETTTSWTAVGAYGDHSDSDAGFFGTAWAPTATANDMALSTGTTYTKTWSNVTIPANTTIYYKVTKNHSWDESYGDNGGTDNATYTVSSAGSYNVTISFDTNTKKPSISVEPVAQSTLTVNSSATADVSATVNGIIVAEGFSTNNVVAGTKVTVNTTAVVGNKVTGVTYTSSSGTSSATALSGGMYTFDMPSSNTAVNVTTTQDTILPKNIYFNNMNTLYSKVFAYVKYTDGGEPFGPYPGKAMTRLDNSNIWKIQIPGDAAYITFRGDNGVNTNDTLEYPNNPDGMMTIPWDTGHTNNPKYTAPYGHNDAPTETNGGFWDSDYSGVRTNEKAVTDGTNMDRSNLFTGISATMYDYYTDNEVTNGWLTFKSDEPYEYSVDNGSKYKWNPYTKFNDAISKYSQTRSVTYPLYFGNLNLKSKETGGNLSIDQVGHSSSTDISNYYHWNKYINNSEDLTDHHNAVTGLTGKTLINSNIHSYDENGTDENGAFLPMFDEDFLSGENDNKETYAQILRSSSFPVRKTVEGASPATKTVYLKNSAGAGFNHTSQVWCHAWNSNDLSETYDTFGYYNNGTWTFSGIPSSYDKILFAKSDSDTEMNYNGGQLSDASFDSNHNTYSATLNNNVYLNLNGQNWPKDSAKLYAHLWNNTNDAIDRDLSYESSTGKYYCNAAGYANVIFYRKDPNGNDWWNKTADLTAYKGRTYKLTDFNGGGNWDVTSNYYSWSWTGSSVVTTPGSTGHTYYKFDSQNGKDNAYIYDDNGSKKIAYYADTDGKMVHAASTSGTNNGEYGFYPFDLSRAGNSKTDNTLAHDLGFGMKLEIPFTLGLGGLNEDNTPQTFDFSGDDDLWVFIDGELVLDLGGDHLRTEGKIDFSTGDVTATKVQQAGGSVTRNGQINIPTGEDDVNTVHTMTIYYMERGMYDSNLMFGFSFHAIPDMVMVDKKVRTDNVNPGFYNVNSQTGAMDGNNPILNDKGKQITKFEHTYQASYGVEDFGITQTSNKKPTNTSVTYTIDSGSPVTVTPSSSNNYQLQYNLYNDQVAYFVGQYDPSSSGSDSTITLSESIPNNSLYRYDTKFTVYDVADNDRIMLEQNGTSGTVTIPQENTSGLNDIRVRARFSNVMKVHSLALTKAITNTADSTTDFTFKVLFKFGSYDYLPYTLDCTVDGVGKKIADDGTISIKAGQMLIIPNIPENALVKVTEVLGNGVTAYNYEGFSMKDSTGSTFSGTTNVTTSTEKGVTFTMSDDLSATVSNSKPQYEYSITYKYQSYGETPLTDSLYGEQSYTVSGIFTDNEALANLTKSGSTVSFIEGKEKNFVISKAPYEDNFMQTLSFANSTLTKNSWTGYKYTCEVTADESNDQNVNVKFKLPYTVAENDLSFAPVENSNQQIDKITAVEHDAGDIEVFSCYLVDSEYVKAPLIIYENSTPYYFQYWKVSKQSNFGMKGNAVYTRCYDYKFNLSIFMDCIIEPVYDTTWAQADTTKNPKAPATYNDYGRFDPEIQIDTTAPITIAFLENSRNQYNNGGKGTRNTTNQAMDVIYSDFLLSYNYAFGGYGKLSERDDVKCGLIVEAVDYMTQTEGNFDYTADYSQDDKYSGSVTNQQLVSWISGGNKPNGCAKVEFDSKKLDNKNSIQYFYSLNNRKLDAKTGNLLNTLQNRYKVFKAYAYAAMYTNGTYSEVQISAPVYFTIYDVGQNGLPDNATTNQ